MLVDIILNNPESRNFLRRRECVNFKLKDLKKSNQNLAI